MGLDEHTSQLPAKRRVGESLPDKVKSGAVGKPVDLRSTLFEKAGITEDEQAGAARKVFDKLVEQLEAQTTKFFAFEGEVVTEKNVADNATQTRATEQLSALLGLEAPKANRTVVVKHELELPDWAKPDAALQGPQAQAKVIDAESYELLEEEQGKNGLARDLDEDRTDASHPDTSE